MWNNTVEIMWLHPSQPGSNIKKKLKGIQESVLGKLTYTNK